jgi:Flp pilus assembly protein TadB
MREDPPVVFAIVSACLPVVVGLIDYSEAAWNARRDPTWETRWRSLEPAERTWLAVVATSRDWMATLTDPEEIRLARGARSRESRRRVGIDLAALPIFIAASVLVLGGVLGDAALLILLFAFGLLRGAWIYRRERQIKGALEEQRAVATPAS